MQRIPVAVSSSFTRLKLADGVLHARLSMCAFRDLAMGGGGAVWTSVRFESEIAVEWRGNEWMNGLFENDSNRVFFEGRIFVRVDVKGQFYFFFFFSIIKGICMVV